MKVCLLLFSVAIFCLAFVFVVDAFKEANDLGAEAIEVIALLFRTVRMESILLAYFEWRG